MNSMVWMCSWMALRSRCMSSRRRRSPPPAPCSAEPASSCDAQQTELADVPADGCLGDREAAAVQLRRPAPPGCGWRPCAPGSRMARWRELASCRLIAAHGARAHAPLLGFADRRERRRAGAHRLVHLLAGDDQRRHQAERARPDRVDDHPAASAAAATWGAMSRLRADADHQTATAHLVDRRTVARRSDDQRLGEVVADRRRRARQAHRSRWCASPRRATAQASGPPPKVEPWSPGSNTSARGRGEDGSDRERRRRVPWQPSSRRERRLSCWCAHQRPVRPMPVCTSSRMSSTSRSSQRRGSPRARPDPAGRRRSRPRWVRASPRTSCRRSPPAVASRSL